MDLFADKLRGQLSDVCVCVCVWIEVFRLLCIHFCVSLCDVDLSIIVLLWVVWLVYIFRNDEKRSIFREFFMGPKINFFKNIRLISFIDFRDFSKWLRLDLIVDFNIIH